MKSCLYNGRIRHRRHRPAGHAFAYGLWLLYLDLDETDTVFAGRWLWSTQRPAPLRFDRRDHMDGSDTPLKPAVARLLAAHGETLTGPVRLLTQPRFFGYVSNPVSFYFCFDADGDTVRQVIAEVTNTPWGERHFYVMTRGAAAGDAAACVFAKEFHVSPFMGMDSTYEWRIGNPGDALRIHNNCVQGDARIFDATLTLARTDITARSLAATFVQRPLQSFRVTAMIYYQALRLWLKRVPFVAHPKKTVPGAMRND